MEDEEYEDVLVISYTDHGSSILPQSTAEKIMKNIRLEVTQSISRSALTEKNFKLRGKSEPTLLDHIASKVIRPYLKEVYQCIRVLYNLASLKASKLGHLPSTAGTVLGQTDSFLFATQSSTHWVTASGAPLYSSPSATPMVNNLAIWRGFLVVFPYNGHVEVWIDSHKTFSTPEKFIGNINSGVRVTSTNIFFRDDRRMLVRLRQSGDTFETTPLIKNVVDFEFCNNTKSVVHLDEQGRLTCGHGSVDLSPAIHADSVKMLPPEDEHTICYTSLTRISQHRYLDRK